MPSSLIRIASLAVFALLALAAAPRAVLAAEPADFQQPLRVVIGLPGAVPPDSGYLFFERKDRLMSRDASEREISRMVDEGSLVVIDASSPGEMIENVLEELYGRGIMMAMLEGGSRVTGSFLDAGEIDQFIYFITPRILGNGPHPVAADGAPLVKDALRLRDISFTAIQEDILYSMEIRQKL